MFYFHKHIEGINSACKFHTLIYFPKFIYSLKNENFIKLKSEKVRRFFFYVIHIYVVHFYVAYTHI